MEKLTQQLSRLAERVATDFEGRGGKLLNNGDDLKPARLAAADGGLGPLLWMASEFLADFEMPFGNIGFQRDEDALTGFSLTAIWSDAPAGVEVMTLAFTDFLRNEVLPEGLAEVDLGQLFSNFNEWCEAQGTSPRLTQTGPEGRPPE
ncbi:hypothetical protein R70006_05016 [Paraburkholderia domus]|uniref:hypothetical protein n=1 Tax=Paraburkholderia domus TaxID=2793075 RepID=UPI001911F858|nr:hypothetical protein [Paraburkholderia domus]MBK5051747.1 hypothetical protein [Burkholderia sp. R-70006]CAE6794693.1 hypothetical protein R70006_05016 [Paraburkholderia domus]